MSLKTKVPWERAALPSSDHLCCWFSAFHSNPFATSLLCASLREAALYGGGDIAWASLPAGVQV